MRLACLSLALALSVAAEARPKVAILNIQRAITSTEDGKAAAAELQRKFVPDQDKLSIEQGEIDELEKQFQDRAARSEEENRQLRSRIDDLTRTHRRHQEDAQRKFDDERRRVLAELGAKILAVVKQLAKQEHFEVVLDESHESSVLWRADKNDITEEVIRRYDLAQRRK